METGFYVNSALIVVVINISISLCIPLLSISHNKGLYSALHLLNF